MQCAPEDGGGFCPIHNTCCPTSVAGVSSCISSRNEDPEGSRGECCDLETGCGYGYKCAVNSTDGHPYCKLEPNPPDYIQSDTNRYELCVVPPTMRDFYGFPVGNGTHRVAYHSNMGDITTPSNAHLNVERVVIIIHGSFRNVDDYFCSALALLDSDNMDSTLIITPLYAAPEDGPILDNILVWADSDAQHPLSHTFRYGADALNEPISSYAVLDDIVQYLSSATVQYPKLSRIAVAGHSAGGQLTHRWALLSSIPAWDTKPHVITIVANPRSYCYLDARRVSKSGDFEVPDSDATAICATYNQWQWGLDDGGFLECPYRDRALAETPVAAMAKRYAARDVVYLSGQFDIITTNDRCETFIFQGPNRQVRAKHYMQGLSEYFGRPVHSMHVVPGSPHDHSLMFQSKIGRETIFGTSSDSVTL